MKDGKPCIICNAEARNAMAPAGIAFTEGLIRDMPPDSIPGVSCWNCYGTGIAGTRTLGEAHDLIKQAQLNRGVHD